MRHGWILRLCIPCCITGAGGVASAQSIDDAGPVLQACVEQVRPVAKSSLAVDAIGSVEDVGSLTVIEFDGDYTRGLTAPRQEIAAQFYATHPDDYDFLVVFSTFEFETGGATAFHNLIRNDTAGIGLPPYDHSAAFGSAGRLQGYIDMAAASRYSFAPSSPGYQDLLTTFLHEVMHRWGMSLRFIDSAGNDSGDLIGADSAHWSYFFDTDASVMLGNDWALQQDGTFRSVDIKHRYSPIDLYAAGFASPSEVPPFMLIRNGTGGAETDLPRLGATSGGTAEVISIGQVIAASGERAPTAENAQKDFTAALVLLKRPGEAVPVERLVELERLRIRAEQQFIAATDGRATLRIFTRSRGEGVRLPTILHGSGAAGSPPGVTAAVSWLESRQASDGHWEDRPATAMRDTVAVVSALSELDPGYPGLARARAWVAANAADNLDQRSWKLFGTGAMDDVGTLELAQNDDGGFAIIPGWSSGAYDTALIGAALAHSAPGSPALVSALSRVGIGQNVDGSFGVADGGQGRILPTLRVAAMFAGRTDPAYVLGLQRAANWITSRQTPDGGIGSLMGVASLSETIETYASSGRVPLEASVAAGIRGHVRRSQQVEGDWGGSVYLTATAVLAQGRDQRPNLSVAGTPTASPEVVYDGQRMTLQATVANLGNVPAATTILRWFDGDPSQGGSQIGTDVSVPELSAGSRTSVGLVWDTTGHEGGHVLWLMVDAAGALEESSEQDNRASIEVTVLPPAGLPDLVLLADDFIAMPVNIASLPSSVRLSGLARNPGMQDAVGVVVRLHEQTRPDDVLAQAVVDVPARGSAAFDLDFIATAPRTLRLLVQADPDAAIEEASDTNNEALIVVPFGESLDLEVLAGDLSLLTSPALVGRPVEFEMVLRNRGTIDSPPVAIRGEIVQGLSTTSVLDALVQVPAGQSVTRRATWLADQPGTAQLRVTIDPAAQVGETDEGNNAANLDFEVVALSEPDLTFARDSLVFTPTPGLEAQPLAAQLVVRNLGSVATDVVLVALYAGDPASGAAMLGSTTVGPIAASGDVVATIGLPELDLRGDQRLFVKIDADDRVDEADESNNVIIKPLRVMSLPDLAISIADIELVPPLPVAGEAVQARVTVRNIGAQDAQGVNVRLLEGDAETGMAVGADGTAGHLPAGASAVLTWNWTLGIATGSHSVTAVADPAGIVREGSEANNVASLPFDMQDGDFFASERYISPNGDGIRDAVAVVFRSSGTDPVTVQIANGAGRTVRRHENIELNEESRGQVVWDGRDDLGRVVVDGVYAVSVIAPTGGGPDGNVLITVDTNRSSLLDAVGTPHGVSTALRGTRRALRVPPAESPLHQHLFAIWRPDGPAEGLYRTDAYFTDVVPVISPAWLERFRLAQGRQSVRLETFEFNPDGSRIAVILSGSGPSATWLLETAVDRVDAPVVIREGGLNRRVLGYFDEGTLVAGAAGGDFLIIDTLSGSVTELRGFPGGIQYDLAKVVPSGVLALQSLEPRAFAPRNPVGSIVRFEPQDTDQNSNVGYLATLSPRGNALAVHEYDRQVESVTLFDLAAGTWRDLARAPSAVVQGVQSGQVRVVPKNGIGWLEHRDQLLVQDAEARTTSVYSTSGQRLSLTSFPELARIGNYAIDGATPPTPSQQDQVLPSTFAALVDTRCDSFGSLSAIGNERAIFDPAANRAFLGFGETVAREHFPEGWALELKAGISDHFSIDLDTGQVDTLQSGTLTPLINSADVARYPLLEVCNDTPAPDWPRVILRDGARIRTDGRVQTMSRGVSTEPWAPGAAIVAIWPDDSSALLADNRAHASLLDLAELLRARTLGRGIELSGVAADRNFAYFRLDWAPIEHPNEWQSLMAPSEDEVFLDEFLTWVPPLPGTFLIRLTVADKAGNTTATFATGSSFESAAIDNFSIAPRYISPNGDGVQDQVAIKYRVRLPVTLTMNVSDAQGAIIRSIDRTYTSLQLGPDQLAWDGRTDGGSVVADGRYRITLGGFGAWVTVDASLPNVTGEIGPPYQGGSCDEGEPQGCARRVMVGPEVTIRAQDNNLAESWLESRLIGNEEWREVLVVSGSRLPPRLYTAREFRAQAIDLAGNRRTVYLDEAEDVMVLQAAGRPGDFGGNPFQPHPEGTFNYQAPPLSSTPDLTRWTSVVVDQSATTDVLVGWNYSRPAGQFAVETASVSDPAQWMERGSYDGDAAQCGPSQCGGGYFTVPFDTSQLETGSSHLVRLRGDRPDGSRIYSNQGYVRVGGIDTPVCTRVGDTVFVSAAEHYDGPLARAWLHYTDDMGHAARADATRYAEHEVGFELILRNAGNAWVEAVDNRGFSHTSPLGNLDCPEPVTDISYRTTIAPFPVIEDQCDGLPSDRVGLILTAALDRDADEPAPRHVKLSYVHGITGEDVILTDSDLPPTILNEVMEFEVPTGLWPEAEHEVRLEIQYVNGTSRVKTTRIPVVKQPPVIDLEQPREGERVCASHADPDLQQFPFVASIVSEGPSSFRMAIGAGEQPLAFECVIAVGEPSPMCTPYALLRDLQGHSVSGAVGVLRTNLAPYGGLSTLQMKGVNWSGGTVCTERTIHLDSTLEYSERTGPQTVIPFSMAGTFAVGVSPTGEPRYQSGKFMFRADEPLRVNATLHRASLLPGHDDLVLDAEVLAVLLQSDGVLGDVDVTWDGLLGTSIAADGLYGISIAVEDDCGFAKSTSYAVLVDATPPEAAFAAPTAGQMVASPVVEIVGSVTDGVRLLGWSLDFALAESPDTWQNLASGDGEVPLPRLLASWSRGSITGAVDLRLSAIDYLGNRSETHLPLTLGQPTTLIGAAMLQPALFSPNLDGVLDSTRLQLGLLRPALVDIRVTDAGAGIVASLHSGPLPAGTSAMPWNGMSGAGQAVVDGAYHVRIDATDPAGIAAPESIALGATVDSTPPVLEILHPSGEYAATTSFVELRLEDAHFAGFEARLTRSIDGVEVLTTSGTQAGDIVLAPLADFAEGAYILQVQARDAVGNLTARSIDFQIDSTLPIVELSTPADGALIPSASATSVSGSVEDPNLQAWTLEVAGESSEDWTELAHGEASRQAGELLSWTPGLADGRYRLRLRAEDHAGNTAQVEHLADVDGTPPLATISTPADGSFLKSDALVEGTASDAHFAGYRLSVIKAALLEDGQWSDIYAGTEPVEDGLLATLTLDLDEDNYLLRLAVTDQVGLVSSQQIGVRIDARPPAAPSTLTGRVEHNRDAVLGWEPVAAADLAGYFVYRDDERVNQLPVQLPNYVDQEVPEGLPKYRVTAVDQAGNESDPSNTVTLLVDRTPPVATILRPGPGERARGVYEIWGTAHSADDFREYRLTTQALEPPGEVATLATATLAVQGQLLATWDTLALADETSVRLKLEAEDIRGNIATSDVVVIIDNEPPAAPTGLTAAMAGADAQVHWNPNAESDLLGYLLYRDNTLVNATGPTLPGDLRPFALTAIEHFDVAVPDGQHQYVVYAIDRAGNVSPPSDPASLDPLDNAPPSMTIESPLSGLRFETQVTVLATSHDTDIAEVRFAYRKVSASDWIDIGAPLVNAPYRVTWMPAQGVPYGDYEIRALARDVGGRDDPEPPSVSVVYADLTPPRPPTVVAARADGDVVHVEWGPSVAPDLAGYRVYRDGEPLEPVSATSLTLDDMSLADGSHAYAVKAFDDYGNESVSSNTVTTHVFGVNLRQPYTPTSAATSELAGSSARPGAMTLQVETAAGTIELPAGSTASDGNFRLSDLELVVGTNTFDLRVADAQGNVSRAATVRIDRGVVPTAPSGLELTLDDHEVMFRWDANPEANVIGYRVFRNGIAHEPDRLLGEIPVASSGQGGDPAAAVDSDPSTSWSPWVVDGDPEGPTPELELAWVEPRIVTAVELSWTEADAAASSVDLFAWSDYAWVHIASIDGDPAAGQSLVLVQPYRTTRMKLVLHGSPGGAGFGERMLSLAEARLEERPLQGARNLAEAVPDGSYAYRVSAVNAFAFESPLSDAVIASVDDTQGPEPVNLTGTLVGRDAHLAWTASPAADAASYDLQRDGEVVASIVAGQRNEHVDPGLAVGEHSYVVIAVDGGGNPGLPSNTVVLTIEGAGPSVPVGLTVTAPTEGRALDVTWQPGPGSPPAIYALRRADSENGPYEAVVEISDTAHHDAPLVNGTTYYYTVEAVDAFGNTSGQSAPANGTPHDPVAPSRPLLTHPTVPADRLRQHGLTADICGKAEAGASIELDRNGQAMASATANVVDGDNVVDLDPSVSSSVPAPDGRHLAVMNYASTLIVDLMDSSTERIFESSRLQAWAAHGFALYFASWQSDEIFRWESGHGLEAVAHPVTSISQFAVNSRETRLAIAGMYEAPGGVPSEGVWLVDRSGGIPLQVQGIDSSVMGWAPTLAWSPDGAYVLMTGESSAWLIDAGVGAAVANWSIDPLVTPTWSSDSRYVAYAKPNMDGGEDLSVFDVYTQMGIRLATRPDPIRALAWSPAGEEIAILDESVIDIVAWPSGASSLLPQHFNGWGWPRLAWTASGSLVAYGDSSSLLNVELPGWFCARSARLAAGINQWSARATDVNGNHGFASEPIEIEVPLDDLPDLDIGDADVLIVPATGMIGQSYVAAITLRNAGSAVVEQPEIAVDLVRPDGSRIALPGPAVPPLAVGQARTLSHAIGVLEMAGAYSLLVRADPREQVFESDEGNNVAAASLMVAADGIPMLEASLAQAVFAPGEAIDGEIAVTNPGAAFSGRVVLRIVDGDGEQVADLGEHAITALGFGQRWRTAFAWDAQGVLAGEYHLRASLYETGEAQLVERQVAFSIEAVRHIQLAIGADAPLQTVGSDVAIRSSLDYSDGNALLEGAILRLVVLDQGGIERWRREQALGTLLPGHALEREDVWPTSGLDAGVYVIRLSLLSPDHAASVDASVTLQAATSGISISGSISFEPGVPLIAGQAQILRWQVANNGDGDLPGVEARLRLLEAASLEPVGEFGESFDLGAGLAHGSSQAVGAPPLALIGHLAILETRLLFDPPGQWRRLAQQGFAVVDRMPPDIAVSSPLEGTLQAAIVPFRASILDLHSAIALADVSVDGGNWQPVSAGADGQYARGIAGLIDGEHALRVRARDTWGNEALGDPVSFSVDATPPSIVITGVTDGDLLNHAVVPQVEVIDTHLATSEVLLDGVAFVSGTPVVQDGTHVLSVRAADLAGNRSLRSLRFEIDSTSPTIAITAPEDGAIVGENAVRVDVQSEIAADIVLVTGGYQASLVADGQGRASFEAVPLVLGSNHVEVNATDRAGNIGLPVSIDVTYEIDDVLPLTGSLQPGVAELAHGMPLLLHVVVQNPNDEAAPAQELRVRVVDAEMVELASHILVRDFGPLETFATDIEFASTGWPLGTLELMLELKQADAWVRLDLRLLELVDGTPPLLMVVAPVADAVSRSPITVVATASDALSGVAAVQARVDAGDWIALAVESADVWASAPLELAEGGHAIELQAHDGAGNVATVAPRSFDIDNTEPLINISGVAHGELLAHPVAPKVDIYDLHLLTSDIRLNGEPFVPGSGIGDSGDYRLEVSAADAAGNEAFADVQFTLDLVKPIVVFIAPEPGAVIADESVDVVGQTEPRARVHFATGSFKVDLDADANGRFDVIAVPIEPGENALVAHATDVAGNVGPEASLTVFREIAAEATIVGAIGELPSSMPAGAWLDVPFNVRNVGDLALLALPLRFELRKAGSEEPVAYDEFTLDLPAGAEWEGSRRLDTRAAASGHYVLSMQAFVPSAGPSAWVVLDVERLGIHPGACHLGDVIFTDGFDRAGVRRDSVIFCDGFEPRVDWSPVDFTDALRLIESAARFVPVPQVALRQAALRTLPYVVEAVRSGSPRMPQRQNAYALAQPFWSSRSLRREVAMSIVGGSPRLQDWRRERESLHNGSFGGQQ